MASYGQNRSQGKEIMIGSSPPYNSYLLCRDLGYSKGSMDEAKWKTLRSTVNKINTVTRRMLKVKAESLAKENEFGIDIFLKNLKTVHKSEKTNNKRCKKEALTNNYWYIVNKKIFKKDTKLTFKGKISLKTNNRLSSECFVPQIGIYKIDFIEPYETMIDIATYYGLYLDVKSQPFSNRIVDEFLSSANISSTPKRHFVCLENIFPSKFVSNLKQGIYKFDEEFEKLTKIQFEYLIHNLDEVAKREYIYEVNIKRVTWHIKEYPWDNLEKLKAYINDHFDYMKQWDINQIDINIKSLNEKFTKSQWLASEIYYGSYTDLYKKHPEDQKQISKYQIQ